jgi:glucose-6-phosphate 1-dehydrogenase
VTPLIDAWASMPPPEFPNDEAGTWGPEAADDLITREGRRWRRL